MTLLLPLEQRDLSIHVGSDTIVPAINGLAEMVFKLPKRTGITQGSHPNPTAARAEDGCHGPLVLPPDPPGPTLLGTPHRCPDHTRYR